MAILVLSIRGDSPALLQAALTSALASLLSNRILQVQFDPGDTARVGGTELVATITYDTSGVVQTAPFTAVVLEARTASELASLAQSTIAATPANFWCSLFAGYIGTEGRRTKPFSGLLLTCTDAAHALSNWLAGGVPGAGGGGGGAPSGPAGGDLYGTYPNPQVGGFRGVPLSAVAPLSGQTWIYNALTGQWVPTTNPSYYVSGAAAAAAAPHINGSFVIIYPGSPTSDAGTWQVTSNQGAAFPGDYTKVSDATNTASEVGIVDAGNYYPGAGNVEVALQDVGSGSVSGPGAALAVATDVLDTVPVASTDSAAWEVTVRNGNLRYVTEITVTHNGTLANIEESGAAPGPGVGVLPITFDADILAGNLRLLAIVTAPGWSYRVRRLALMTV